MPKSTISSVPPWPGQEERAPARDGSFLRILTASILLLLPAPSFGQASLYDSSFAPGSGANGLVYSILVQADGKILVGGDFTQIAGQTHPYLACLNSDGQIDPTFPGGTDGTVYRLVEQSDGKVLVGGYFTHLQGVAREGIGRIETNGAVDLSFGGAPSPGPDKAVFGLAVQPDGKILMANFPGDGELFRLNTNGQLDASFVQTNLFQGWYIFAIYPHKDGSILVGDGFGAVNNFATPGLALLQADGQLDTNYNSKLETNSNPTAIVEQPDGSLLVGGGMRLQDSTNRMLLARLTPDLAWDATFQPDLIDPEVSAYVNSVAVLPGGKILLGGSFEQVGGFWRRGVAQLDSRGHVDPCFDPGLGLAPRYAFGVVTLARQADGRILAGGDFVDLVSEGAFTDNIVRLLPQSDCGVTRAYLRRLGDRSYFVGATFPPGGTNCLQVSTNLVDWVDQAVSTLPYCYDYYYQVGDAPQVFVRGKKQY
jgi:uncharacterized delta-60 repeat protein